PAVDGFTLAASYVPADAGFKAGGDWYDVIPLEDGRFGLVIGDVSGHGLEAASVMGQLRSAVRAYALEGHGPEHILSHADRLLRTIAPDELATMLYSEIDTDRGTMRVVTAGHPPPIIGNAGQARYLELPPGPPIGVPWRRGSDPVGTTIEPGTLVLMYTDGLVERRGLPLDMGLDRLRSAVLAGIDRPLAKLCHDLVAVLVPDEASDDVAVLGVQMHHTSEVFTLRIPAEPE